MYVHMFADGGPFAVWVLQLHALLKPTKACSRAWQARQAACHVCLTIALHAAQAINTVNVKKAAGVAAPATVLHVR